MHCARRAGPHEDLAAVAVHASRLRAQRTVGGRLRTCVELSGHVATACTAQPAASVAEQAPARVSHTRAVPSCARPPSAAHAAGQASHRAPPVGSDPAAGAALRQPAGARPARALAQRRACEPESSELGSAPQATQCTAWSCPVSSAVHCTSAEVQLQVRTLRPRPPGGQCGRRMPVWRMPQGPLLPVCRLGAPGV